MTIAYLSNVTNPRTKRLAANVSSTIVTVTLVPNLAIPLTVGIWRIYGKLNHQSAATTTGMRIQFIAAGGLVAAGISGNLQFQTTATVTTSTRIAALGTDIVTTGVVTANIFQISDLFMMLNVTTAGILNFSWATEIAASAAQLNLDTILWAESLD